MEGLRGERGDVFIHVCYCILDTYISGSAPAATIMLTEKLFCFKMEIFVGLQAAICARIVSNESANLVFAHPTHA